MRHHSRLVWDAVAAQASLAILQSIQEIAGCEPTAAAERDAWYGVYCAAWNLGRRRIENACNTECVQQSI